MKYCIIKHIHSLKTWIHITFQMDKIEIELDIKLIYTVQKGILNYHWYWAPKPSKRWRTSLNNEEKKKIAYTKQ